MAYKPRYFKNQPDQPEDQFVVRTVENQEYVEYRAYSSYIKTKDINLVEQTASYYNEKHLNQIVKDNLWIEISKEEANEIIKGWTKQ